ncbi:MULTISPECIES: HAD hydrolase-like protein [Vitreoscilla]|uniref:HAD hydrolase-like protein n=1 Tax=Vitreoscilla stercoraria TaxID=61 RepID=A0ABY4E7J3_VITST|nr:MULTISPECIES: HAD hydrolase-like protein [Vitreoscilla]AUZ04923.2 HAD-like domain-containing protein [Vitreoscilla sp. C1]UOO91424.1 HAD hydrolase-like protein [Vitreoscilla stercoraria]
MSVHTILLDLDGTLTDPKIGITTCIRYGLAKVGHPIHEEIDLDWCIGPPLHASLEQLLPPEYQHLTEEALAGYRERFGDIGLFENEVYPSVAETLNTLQQQGYALILATAKPTVYAKRILEHFGLSPYFTAIHGSELDGTRTNKGELIAHILHTHDLSADKCIMVGDREFDVLGARANGMPVIGASYGYGSTAEWQQSPADAQMNTFADLLNVLEHFQDA